MATTYPPRRRRRGDQPVQLPRGYYTRVEEDDYNLRAFLPSEEALIQQQLTAVLKGGVNQFGFVAPQYAQNGVMASYHPVNVKGPAGNIFTLGAEAPGELPDLTSTDGDEELPSLDFLLEHIDPEPADQVPTSQLREPTTQLTSPPVNQAVNQVVDKMVDQVVDDNVFGWDCLDGVTAKELATFDSIFNEPLNTANINNPQVTSAMAPHPDDAQSQPTAPANVQGLQFNQNTANVSQPSPSNVNLVGQQSYQRPAPIAPSPRARNPYSDPSHHSGFMASPYHQNQSTPRNNRNNHPAAVRPQFSHTAVLHNFQHNASSMPGARNRLPGQIVGGYTPVTNMVSGYSSPMPQGDLFKYSDNMDDPYNPYFPQLNRSRNSSGPRISGYSQAPQMVSGYAQTRPAVSGYNQTPPANSSRNNSFPMTGVPNRSMPVSELYDNPTLMNSVFGGDGTWINQAGQVVNQLAPGERPMLFDEPSNLTLPFQSFDPLPRGHKRARSPSEVLNQVGEDCGNRADYLNVGRRVRRSITKAASQLGAGEKHTRDNSRGRYVQSDGGDDGRGSFQVLRNDAGAGSQTSVVRDVNLGIQREGVQDPNGRRDFGTGDHWKTADEWKEVLKSGQGDTAEFTRESLGLPPSPPMSQIQTQPPTQANQRPAEDLASMDTYVANYFDAGAQNTGVTAAVGNAQQGLTQVTTNSYDPFFPPLFEEPVLGNNASLGITSSIHNPADFANSIGATNNNSFIESEPLVSEAAELMDQRDEEQGMAEYLQNDEAMNVDWSIYTEEDLTRMAFESKR